MLCEVKGQTGAVDSFPLPCGFWHQSRKCPHHLSHLVSPPFLKLRYFYNYFTQFSIRVFHITFALVNSPYSKPLSPPPPIPSILPLSSYLCVPILPSSKRLPTPHGPLLVSWLLQNAPSRLQSRILKIKKKDRREIACIVRQCCSASQGVFSKIPVPGLRSPLWAVDQGSPKTS